MKLLIKLFLSGFLFIALFYFSSCNNNNDSGIFKTKEDSIAFAKSIAKLYPEVCVKEIASSTWPKLIDTIKLPENLANNKLNESLYYKYAKQGNLLVSLGFNFQAGLNFAPPSGEVPVTDANKWIQNYRTDIGRRDLNKTFALNVEKKDLKVFYDTADCAGFRLYFGKKTLGSDEISIILTGYKNDASGNPGEDFYINRTDASGARVTNVVDDMTKCPTMCPRTDATKKMLGLFIGTSVPTAPTDRPQ